MKDTKSLFQPGDTVYTSKYGSWWLWGTPEIIEHTVVAVSPNGRLKVDKERGYRDVIYFLTREEAWSHYRQLAADKIAALRAETHKMEKFSGQCHD